MPKAEEVNYYLTLLGKTSKDEAIEAVRRLENDDPRIGLILQIAVFGKAARYSKFIPWIISAGSLLIAALQFLI